MARLIYSAIMSLDQVRLHLALAGERRFGSGVVYLCYRPA